MNWYAYVGGNPVVGVDPRGWWGSEWHGETTESAALAAGFDAEAASAIAQAARDIDNVWTLMSLPHFDIRIPLIGTVQSKRDFAMMNEALARSYYQEGNYNAAWTALGQALHAIQDDYAHGSIWPWEHRGWMDDPEDPRRAAEASAAFWETLGVLGDWPCP